jgi:hypothetical protein
MPKLPFELGVGHYDEPPPDRIEGPRDLEQLRDADRFREANPLHAWIQVEDGAIVDAGYFGGGLVGSTAFRFGPKAIVVPGVAFEVLRRKPVISGDRPRFVQTVGGRAGFPAPRLVKGGPLFRIHSATAWTTLALTLHADGPGRARARGREPVPAPLDLRQRRRARGEERHRRLQGVVSRVARRQHAVGQRRVGGGGRGGGERARARADAGTALGRREARPAQASARARCW